MYNVPTNPWIFIHQNRKMRKRTERIEYTKVCKMLEV